MGTSKANWFSKNMNCFGFLTTSLSVELNFVPREVVQFGFLLSEFMFLSNEFMFLLNSFSFEVD